MEGSFLPCAVFYLYFPLTLSPPPGDAYRSGSGENRDRKVELSPQEDWLLFMRCVTAHKRWHNKGFSIK